MTRSDLPALDDFMCFTVYSANHAFGRLYKPLLVELGLTYPQYLVMMTLWEEDGQTVGAIGQKLFLESNTLTPMLKRLSALGLVTRVRDTCDERQVHVHLTKSGHALRAKAKDVPERIGEALDLTLNDIAALRDDLASLRDRMLKAAAKVG